MNRELIVVATANMGKLREFSQAFDAENFAFKSLAEVGFTADIVENGSTFAENSHIKAQTVYAYLQSQGLKAAVLADDSGLTVTALAGAPGVYSARFAGLGATDAQNNAKLLRDLATHADRSASFVCCLTYIDSQGTVHQFTGACPGHITTAPQGTEGFGYDPLFVPHGYENSFAQMSVEQKRALSHRGQALELLAQFLQSP